MPPFSPPQGHGFKPTTEPRPRQEGEHEGSTQVKSHISSSLMKLRARPTPTTSERAAWRRQPLAQPLWLLVCLVEIAGAKMCSCGDSFRASIYSFPGPLQFCLHSVKCWSVLAYVLCFFLSYMFFVCGRSVLFCCVQFFFLTFVVFSCEMKKPTSDVCDRT